jgi:adenosylcobyric acid synthase
MLGRRIDDPVESGAGSVEGLGLLPVDTRFEADKVTKPRAGRATGILVSDLPVTGYQIHHGRTTGDAPWIHLDDRWGVQAEGACNADRSVLGTSLHGLFEGDEFRTAFLAALAARRGVSFAASGVSFAAAREAQFDRLADLVEDHLDMAAVEKLIAAGAPALPVPIPETS